ncbi:ABC-2 type transport system permease protein [Oceanobacillus limi]|uniref:ABC-2 type transport system permease protein n=1 Tax=Oceanobacillus limi TaxID=930131 RepID=A0A1I0EG61_9BACI|nr:ABC transporter permease [Oceanobacillus limi]SET44031.1 ABC-2 type transport system permease protein [Oceanobacillus limi]
MRDVFHTRIIMWKKQWISLLFWLLFPLLATILIITVSNTIQEDSRVPVGIVLEEETPLAMGLYESIQASSLVHINKATEEDALHLLTKHELDSVFIVHEGYEEQIQNGSRSNLITSYQTERSFAYAPVKEMIISLVQQETGRSKAAQTVQAMDEEQNWSSEAIINKSKEIQAKENLLNTSFQYLGANTFVEDEDKISWNPWTIWAVLSFLSTFLIMDWVIKEKSTSVLTRFYFTKVGFQKYAIHNLFLYTILMFLFDFISLMVFYFYLDSKANILVLISYRVMISLLAFLFVLLFRNVYVSYCVTFAITSIIAIASGMFLPSQSQIDWLGTINPLQQFLSGEITVLWLLICISMVILWYFRKEHSNA